MRASRATCVETDTKAANTHCLTTKGDMERLLAFSLLLSLTVHLSQACSDTFNCMFGYCVPRDRGGERCVCLEGYTGEKCDVYSPSRMSRDDGGFSPTCSCENGGTCMDEGDLLGEASCEVLMGECFYTCLCPAGFTGDFCSEKIGNNIPYSTVWSCSQSRLHILMNMIPLTRLL